ncbi:MAG: U32 family peptidase, partial [Anaerotignaceae bacterium]
NDVEIEGDTNIYMGMSLLNQLRRDAISGLEEEIITSYKNKKSDVINHSKENNKQYKFDKKLNVHVSNLLQFKGAITGENVNIIYMELSKEFMDCYEECIQECYEQGIKLYVAVPRVYRDYTDKIYGKALETLKNADIDGFLVRSIGQFKEFKETNKPVVVDFGFNVFNSEDVNFWSEEGAKGICLSPELNLAEINLCADENCEMIGYGHLPLMTTHQCPVGADAGGKESGMGCSLKGNNKTFYLKDRKGEQFPLITDCDQCICTILNGKPLFTLKFFDEILASPTGAIRLMFTTESAKEVERIINCYSDCLKDWVEPSQRAKNLTKEMTEKGSTKGHFFRGIE